MTEKTAFVSVATERILRMRAAINLASEGAYAEAIQLLEAAPKDDFGDVERLLGAFVQEFKVAIQQNEAALDELKAVKQAEIQQKVDIIERQREAIGQLATPIIDVWDRVLTVPLLGLLDSARAQQLTSRLLDQIQQKSTAWVILDLTGIDLVDAPSADHILKLVGAVRLMGAECLVTGIVPSVAQTFVSIGAELSSVRTMANLKDGLRYCLLHERTRS